jgi:thimet oligopeptidase
MNREPMKRETMKRERLNTLRGATAATAMVMLGLCLPVGAANAASTAPTAPDAAAVAAARPTIPLLAADTIPGLCETTLSGLRTEVKRLEALPPARSGDTRKVFTELNDLQIRIEDLQGPVEILNNVSPDKAVRDNAEACLVAITKFSTDLLQSEKLYARFKAVKPRDAIDVKMRKNTLESFEDTGVALPAEKRQRMNAILGRLDELAKEFSRTIRDNNQKLVFTADEVKGLPPAYLAAAKRDDQGNYLLGFDYPSYNPFMEYADDGAARKRYQIAFTNRGTPKNLATLKEAMDLRKEMAGLFGLPSYAHFAIRRKMAQDPEAVYKFLGEVGVAVKQVEGKELDELRDYRAKATGVTPEAAKIERWDVGYWQRKLKAERYTIDQTALRKYFPTDAVIPWIMQVSSTLYGIDFKRAEVPLWHPEVQYYDVFDSASHARIGGIYLDMFPRDGKYGHAAAWPTRGSTTLANRTPISVLVTNFDRAGLDSDELETMVHEFGHVLHGVLSHTRYLAQSGTSVEGDFVEAPSQMYEEWARTLEPLSLIAGFCKNGCPAVDAALVKRLDAAHNYGRGIRYSRQLNYASFDMDIHNKAPGDPLVEWDRMENATLLGHIPQTQFPGQFDHLMNGYGAGYYGYMWSEVMALDMLSRYQAKLMNPAVGMRYRKTILSRGSEATGSELVRDFLGRAPNSKAFFDEISGKRIP